MHTTSEINATISKLQINFTPRQIHDQEFRIRWKGYDRDEVNDFLDLVIADQEKMLNYITALEKTLKDVSSNLPEDILSELEYLKSRIALFESRIKSVI